MSLAKDRKVPAMTRSPTLTLTRHLLIAGALTVSTALAGCGSDEPAPAAESAQAPPSGAVAVAAAEAPAAIEAPGVEAEEAPAPVRELADPAPEGDEMTFDPEGVPPVEDEPEVAAAAVEAPRASKSDKARKRDEGPANLKLVEVFIAPAVEDRMPVRPEVNFTADVQRLWAWVKIENHDQPSHVTMIWKHRGVEKTRVKLNVGVSSGWRTWSKREMGREDVGAWHVEIEDANGKLLDTMEFWIKPGNNPKVRRL